MARKPEDKPEGPPDPRTRVQMPGFHAGFDAGQLTKKDKRGLVQLGLGDLGAATAALLLILLTSREYSAALAVFLVVALVSIAILGIVLWGAHWLDNARGG